jgi:hypothetical protein
MIRTKLTGNKFLVFSWIAIVTATSAVAIPSVRSFRNTTYGYSVEYPVNWHFAGDSSHFEIHTFSPAESVRGVVIPEGGAGISLYVPTEVLADPSSVPQNLDDWVRGLTARQRIVSRASFGIRSSGRTLHIVEVKVRCCGNAEQQIETIEWFFTVEGRLFGASLGYREGDPKVEGFRTTLEAVVLSLRVLPENQGGKSVRNRQ